MAAQKERRKHPGPTKLTIFVESLGLFPFLVLLGVEITKTEGEGRGMLLFLCYYRVDGISRRNTHLDMDAELSGYLSCARNDVR